jgi:hypothetical protein
MRSSDLLVKTQLGVELDLLGECSLAGAGSRATLVYISNMR